MRGSNAQDAARGSQQGLPGKQKKERKGEKVRGLYRQAISGSFFVCLCQRALDFSKTLGACSEVL
jgi:hypothetical protein